MALAFIILRVSDCISKNEYKWADLCAVLAFVSAQHVSIIARLTGQIFSLPMDIFEFFSALFEQP